MNARFFLQFVSASGFIAVALGAFGAHALKDKLLSNNLLETYQTAVQYQFYHTLSLLGIALLMSRLQTPLLGYSGWCMMIGIFIFSGSLYTLCFTGMKWLGAVTPIGGLFLLAGWALLFWAVLKSTM